MFNFFSKKTKVQNPDGSSTYPADEISFRVVFMSPFFELEVDGSGNGWHSVHSQDAELDEATQTMVYPMLRFTSFDDATTYATKVLGLTKMVSGRHFFGLIMAPPASYMTQAKVKKSDSHSITAARPSMSVKQVQIKVYKATDTLAQA